jgi:ABC-2 type transport system ATP-binding protein
VGAADDGEAIVSTCLSGDNTPGKSLAHRPSRGQTEAMVPSAPALRAQGLVKAFRDTRAVNGVDLDVATGERVALLGPNGAGKTTTLLMLLGTITPDQGTVEIFGHHLPKGRSQAMEQVGFAAGYLPLPDRLRVREVLGIFADLCGADRSGDPVGESLERFGVSHLVDKMCVELSSGQRTVVGIAKAILHRPALLVLDEPTASLDPDVALRVRRGLETLNADEGTTLLVTSHNMTEVERLCERVVFLQHGRVVADGHPSEVTSAHGRESLEDVFLHLAAGQEQPPEAEAS